MNITVIRYASFLLIILLSFSTTPVYAFDYESIPADRMPPDGWSDITWSDPGSWVLYNVTKNGLPANDESVDAAVKIQEIIADHPGTNMILYFPPGTYHFYTDLQITSSNVRLMGAGMEQTTFELNYPSNAIAGIEFAGSGFAGSPVSVTASSPLGSNSVTVSNVSAFSTGDFVQLYTKKGPSGGSDYFYTQILEIDSIDSANNTLVFTRKLGLDFLTSDEPMIRKLNMIENVGISNVKVWRVRDNADWSKNIVMKFVNNGYVTDVDSSFAANEHISFVYSYQVIAERNLVHEAYNYGTGGHGYGIVVNYGTTNAKVTNNKLWTLRHHILLQKGANHSVISYNSLEARYKNADTLCLHGHYSHNNLFEGNMFADSYADSVWGASGPRNTWFRNHATNNIGSSSLYTNTMNVIGNYLLSIYNNGADHYFGANRQRKGDILWGSLNEYSNIPASLYLTTKPAFFGAKPWPLFGPGVTDWGRDNTLPARDRNGAREVIVDNLNAELTGTWPASKYKPKFLNENYFSNTTGTGEDTVKWRPNLGAAGDYWVYYWLPDGMGGDRASNAPFTVYHNAGSTTYQVNQQVAGGEWILLGKHNFAAGTSGYVELTDNANGSYVIADAVKFVLDEPVPQPLPESIIVDNTAMEFTGTWPTSTFKTNYFGTNYQWNETGTGTDSARWRPNIASAGNYSVYYRIPDGLYDRATNAPFTVYYNGGSKTYLVNEQTVPGGQWVLLGTHNFAAGTSGYVELTDHANGSYVIADAIKFVKQ